MKVSSRIAFKMTLVLALLGLAACSSDQEEMDEAVATEQGEQGEFSEFSETDPNGDNVEDGMLADDLMTDEPIYDDKDVMDEVAADASGSEFGDDSQFDTSMDEPINDNAQSFGYESDAATETTWEQVEVADKTPSYSQSIPAASFSLGAQSYGNDTTAAAGHYQHSYVVQAGDTLSIIARRIYGDAGKWSKLASMNSLSNPHKIFPGDTIFFESNSNTDDFASAFDSVSKKNYVVQPGDTLAGIAHKVYGTSSRWKVLWGYNWKKVENPNKIFVGQKLWYVRNQDMKNFLAEIDKDMGAPAQVVSNPKPAPVQTVSQAVVASEPEPVASEPVVEEVVEEVVVEEEIPVEEEVIYDEEDSEIIEDIVVDDEAVMEDEEVLDEDFEEIEDLDVE